MRRVDRKIAGSTGVQDVGRRRSGPPAPAGPLVCHGHAKGVHRRGDDQDNPQHRRQRFRIPRDPACDPSPRWKTYWPYSDCVAARRIRLCRKQSIPMSAYQVSPSLKDPSQCCVVNRHDPAKGRIQHSQTADRHEHFERCAPIFQLDPPGSSTSSAPR